MRLHASHPLGRHVRCIVNGKDMSDATFDADDWLGIAWAFLRNSKGRVMLIDKELVEETWRGYVEIVPRADADKWIVMALNCKRLMDDGMTRPLTTMLN